LYFASLEDFFFEPESVFKDACDKVIEKKKK
jgi:hypothetical protein